MENAELDPMFGAGNEVKLEFKTVKFGKVGDYIKGTLVNNTKQLVNNLSPKKEMQTVFEIKVQAGSLHLINKKVVDAEPTIPQPGEFWSFITSKAVMLDMLKGIRIGQIVGLRLDEIRAAKTAGYDDTKIIKVYPGIMDDTYQGESGADVA